MGDHQANYRTANIVKLTQKCRSSCILRLDASRSGEALRRVAAAVIEAQLLAGGLGGHQLLWHLLLPATLLTPQLMTVLPKRKAVETEKRQRSDDAKNNRRVGTTRTESRTLEEASCPDPRL